MNSTTAIYNCIDGHLFRDIVMVGHQRHISHTVKAMANLEGVVRLDAHRVRVPDHDFNDAKRILSRHGWTELQHYLTDSRLVRSIDLALDELFC